MRISNWREWINQSKNFSYAFLLVSYVILQILLALIAEPNHSFKNLYWYFGIAEQIRRVGLFAVWTPYPPLFSLFIYLISILSEWESFFLFWRILNIAMVLAIGFLIYRIAERVSKETALVSACSYLLINAITNSAITIGYYFDQYDYIPLLIMMASLYMLLNDRPVESAWLCGIGTMLKLFPIVLLPVALLHLEKEKRVSYILYFALACSIAVLPWLMVSADTQRSFYKFTLSRDAWETIWNFPDLKFPPIPTPKSLTLPFDSDASPYPWLTWLTAAFALGCLWWHGRKKNKNAMPRILLSLLLVFLIFSRGISSYYIFWLFPLLFVIYKPVYAFAVCAALMLVGNIEFAGATSQPLLLPYWLSIFTRHAVFLGLLIQSLTGYRASQSAQSFEAGSMVSKEKM